ncbi:ScbA/BarX family gamma-butyrolactone biosynthesis protein [Streptomyces albidoflavus]|uniref:ScbA/BarX family gamma-butyrolactone biosynthesis protein n=1 Tax=Streptomyces albidoflavus TaxID=1886 RepID=UPI00340D5E63
MSVLTVDLHRPPPAPEAPCRPGAGGTGTLLARPTRSTAPAPAAIVPKELVHRHNPAEVLLTGWERRGEDSFGLTARWPADHRFFADVNGCHDPMLAAETIRQAGSLLLHAEYEVPFGHHFVMRDLSLSTRQGALAVRALPGELELDVTCHDIRRRGKAVLGLYYEAVLRRDGQVVGHGGASVSCVTPAAYRRLRAPQLDGAGPQPPLTAPVAPHDVGRHSPADVVLSPTEERGRWLLRTDTSHPVLFEHPVDHVPGMMLLEAARQAAIATLGHTAPPSELTGEFSRYAELHRPCLIEARRLPAPGDQESVLVTGEQDGEEVFRSVITLPHAED